MARQVGADEMARQVGVDEASALGRNVFGVKRVVFPVAGMPRPKRRGLLKRLFSELGAVRGAISKAELLYSCVSGAAAGAGKDGRLSAPEAAAAVEEDGGCRAAKSRKVSPSAERATEESKRDDRERLAGRLASMAAALPDHVVAFLLNRRRAGDADSRGVDGEIEKDGALFQLKMFLDKFAPEESTPKLLAPEMMSTPKSRGGHAPLALASSGISCLSLAEHKEDAGGRLPPAREEEEAEEGINICGGVSRIALRDIAEEYGELVEDIGVELLSPLRRKYAELDEQDGYVDICGDASPVVFPSAKAAGDCSSPSSSTSSGSDSDTTTSSDSGSSRTSPEALPEENSHRGAAGEPAPAPEADPVQGKHPEPAPEAIQIAEPENQCAAAAVIAITKSPPAPVVPPKESGALAQPPEQAPEAAQIAEPERELKEKSVAPAAAAVHPTTGAAPPPAVLPSDNGSTSSQPAPVPAAAPVAAPAQIAEPPPPPQPQPQEVQEAQTTNELIARAWQQWTRRELLRMARAARPDERIHPRDMDLLGVAAFEHVVSTARDARTPRRLVNGRPSILQQLDVFLKADSGGGEEEEEDKADGQDMNDDMEIEDGQILEERK